MNSRNVEKWQRLKVVGGQPLLNRGSVYQDVKRGPSLNVVGEDRGVDEASQISDVAPGSILQRKLSWKTVGTSTRSPIT